MVWKSSGLCGTVGKIQILPFSNYKNKSKKHVAKICEKGCDRVLGSRAHLFVVNPKTSVDKLDEDHRLLRATVGSGEAPVAASHEAEHLTVEVAELGGHTGKGA